MTRQHSKSTMPASFDEAQREFYDRGEAAWTEYLRTGAARPVDAVFERIEALVAERAKQLRADSCEGQP